MESNFGSSESNYGFGGYSGRSFGGYSSESSYASESRDTYRPSPSFSSESALESRDSSIYSPESRQTSTPSYGASSSVKSSGSKKTYNSLDDVDKLIERLESSLGSTNVTSERANQILAERKQKIESLKQLVAEARKAEAEEKMIKQLEQENSELDDAIDNIGKRFHR